MEYRKFITDYAHDVYINKLQELLGKDSITQDGKKVLGILLEMKIAACRYGDTKDGFILDDIAHMAQKVFSSLPTHDTGMLDAASSQSVIKMDNAILYLQHPTPDPQLIHDNIDVVIDGLEAMLAFAEKLMASMQDMMQQTIAPVMEKITQSVAHAFCQQSSAWYVQRRILDADQVVVFLIRLKDKNPYGYCDFDMQTMARLRLPMNHIGADASKQIVVVTNYGMRALTNEDKIKDSISAASYEEILLGDMSKMQVYSTYQEYVNA